MSRNLKYKYNYLWWHFLWFNLDSVWNQKRGPEWLLVPGKSVFQLRAWEMARLTAWPCSASSCFLGENSDGVKQVCPNSRDRGSGDPGAPMWDPGSSHPYLISLEFGFVHCCCHRPHRWWALSRWYSPRRMAARAPQRFYSFLLQMCCSACSTCTKPAAKGREKRRQKRQRWPLPQGHPDLLLLFRCLWCSDTWSGLKGAAGVLLGTQNSGDSA